MGEAHRLATLLQSCGLFQVRATGGATPATRSEILAGLEWLAAGAVAGDTLFFVFEGEGADPPVSSPLRDIEGWVQRFVPADVESAGPIDHHTIYQTLVAPLPKDVRVLLIVDTFHDGSLFDLKHVVAVQASRQPAAPPLPPAIADREYDNREWDVSIHLRRRAVYREPAADIVTMAPGRIDGRASGRAVSAVACATRAVERACEEGKDCITVFQTAPLVALCKHASAELQLDGGAPSEYLLLSATAKPLSTLICSLG